jgi:hypothetical protein
MHRCFIRWRDAGIWEKLLEILIDDPDYEGLMIDAPAIAKSIPMRREPAGRKRFPAPEKMARHRHKICQELKIIPRGSPDPVYRPMG